MLDFYHLSLGSWAPFITTDIFYSRTVCRIAKIFGATLSYCLDKMVTHSTKNGMQRPEIKRLLAVSPKC